MAKKIKDCENFSDANINMTIQFQVLTVHTMASIFIHVTTVSAKRTHQQVIPQKRTQTKQVEGFTPVTKTSNRCSHHQPGW